MVHSVRARTAAESIQLIIIATLQKEEKSTEESYAMFLVYTICYFHAYIEYE